MYIIRISRYIYSLYPLIMHNLIRDILVMSCKNEIYADFTTDGALMQYKVIMALKESEM